MPKMTKTLAKLRFPLVPALALASALSLCAAAPSLASAAQPSGQAPDPMAGHPPGGHDPSRHAAGAHEAHEACPHAGHDGLACPMRSAGAPRHEGHRQEGHHPSAHAGHGPGHAAHAGAHGGHGALPGQVGQDAFAALAEMRTLLEADPSTDWSKVDLDALRDHLVDMNRVVLDAQVTVRRLPAGFEAELRGHGRTAEAIRRMLPAHGRFMNGSGGLNVVVSMGSTEGGDRERALVRVTTEDEDAVARLQALGFFGFLTAGDHHRPHHLAMARGEGHP